MYLKTVSCSHSTQDLGNIREEPEVGDDWGKTVSSEYTMTTTLMSSQKQKIMAINSPTQLEETRKPQSLAEEPVTADVW